MLHDAQELVVSPPQVMEALAKIQAGEKFDAVSTHARRGCQPTHFAVHCFIIESMLSHD
jgi:hypothetical protein